MDKVLSFPPFLQKVLVNKRTWKNRQFESVKMEVSYLCPAWADQGHWVRKDGENPMVTRFVLQKLETPPNEMHWIALEREVLDPIAIRRRIRGKTIRNINVAEGEDQERVEEERMSVKYRVLKVIEEEMLHLGSDEPEAAVKGLRAISKLKKFVSIATPEEEVLQTRIISPKEVNQNWSEWLGPAEDEVRSMLEEKQALRPVKRKELEEIMKKAKEKNRKVELIPSKLVFTKKPAPPPKGHKNKVRWVVCGNFEPKKESEENYSGGADAASFRILIHHASKHQWDGASVNVRTAFLNADLVQSDQEDLVLINSPYHLVERGILEKETMYEPLKAVYGFRRSPRLWGLCRDDTLLRMDIEVKINAKVNHLVLTALDSKPNLWTIKDPKDDFGENGNLYGLLMTYVDDMFVVGTAPLVEAVLQKIQSTWITSTPERVSSEPIKFLGMEVSKHYNTNLGGEVWRITQESYLKDLLAKEENLKVRLIPITKDQASWTPPEVPPTPELVRLAQNEVGSILWLVTRTRPNIMYAVAKLSSLVTRDPKKALDIAAQVKGFLKGTVYEGLEFASTKQEPEEINAFSDASFAPEGDYSHGCTTVMLQQSPILWKSGKQQVAKLSTAEAELLEVVEALTMGESIYVIAKELDSEVTRVAWCDSQSAVSILTNEGGSWRTRHLRIRASFARATIKQGNWLLHHVAGTHMIADIGTKALTSSRLDFLKKMFGMKGSLEGEIQKMKKAGANQEGSVTHVDPLAIAHAIRVITALALFETAEGLQENQSNLSGIQDQEVESAEEFQWMVYLYTILVVLMTICTRSLVEAFYPWISRRGGEVIEWGKGRWQTWSQRVHPSSTTSTSSPVSISSITNDLSESPFHAQGRGSRGDL